MRTFIAVTIPPSPPLRTLRDELAEFGTALRPADPDSLHLTLKFLGETDKALVADVGRIVGEIAAAHAPFDVRLTGLGVFPRIERPNVIWVGLQDVAALTALAKELEPAVAELGFPPENRAFHPHLTVARVKRRPPETLRPFVEQGATRDFGSCRVESLEYYESELRPEGPRYHVLCRSQLAEASE